MYTSYSSLITHQCDRTESSWNLPHLQCAAIRSIPIVGTPVVVRRVVVVIVVLIVVVGRGRVAASVPRSPCGNGETNELTKVWTFTFPCLRQILLTWTVVVGRPRGSVVVDHCLLVTSCCLLTVLTSPRLVGFLFVSFFYTLGAQSRPRQFLLAFSIDECLLASKKNALSCASCLESALAEEQHVEINRGQLFYIYGWFYVFYLLARSPTNKPVAFQNGQRGKAGKILKLTAHGTMPTV